MQKLMLWIVGATMFLGGTLHAQDLAGNWQGTLQAGNGLRIVMKVTKDDNKLRAVSYSIDQGGAPIAITSISLQGSAVNFAIKALDLTYVGTMNPDGKTISGNQTQGGQTHVLNFERVSPENTWPIPEPPRKMAADAKPGFEVATIKPSTPGRPGKGIGFRGRHFTTVNFNVNDLIGIAYKVHEKQIVGAPAWFGTTLFDIDGVPDVEGQPSPDQMNIMIQKLLADRFHLVFHHEKRELAVYAITLGKGGPKMTISAAAPSDPQAFFFRKLGALTVRNQTMVNFASWMQTVMDKPVVDQSSLPERYDFTLNWTPDESQFAQFRGTGVTVSPPTDDPNAPPGLFTAIQEQLGMKLEPTKAKADVMVIDHVEQPSAN
ncbi:MAG TPA: TIGR03435 family protein [Acidobacteriaceae bacterium]